MVQEGVGFELLFVGTLMVKMVESKEYEGGTCVLKTPYEERIEEDGYTKMEQKRKEYDPSPRYELASPDPPPRRDVHN